MNLFVSSYGSKVGVLDGKLTVNASEISKEYSISAIDSITLYPGVTVTQPAIKELSKNKKNVFWVSGIGETYANALSPKTANIVRQKLQFDLMDDADFSLEISKRFIVAKIKNQLTFLRRIDKNFNIQSNRDFAIIKSNIKKASRAKTTEELEGIEGYTSKLYFSAIKKVIPAEYDFAKRTKHPPKDCFSAALSFAYTLLYNDIVIAIQNAGLSPFIGFMHKLKNGHYALASDLMEEYRSIVCDSVVIRLFINKQFTKDDFVFNDDESVYLKSASSKKIIEKYEKQVNSPVGYMKKNGMGKSIRDSFAVQVYELIEAMENKNPSIYKPVSSR